MVASRMSRRSRRYFKRIQRVSTKFDLQAIASAIQTDLDKRNVSYDEAFDTRVSADLKVRFGGASTTAQRKEVQQLPVINALTSTPTNRDVRVHDDAFVWCVIKKMLTFDSSDS